MNHQVQPKRFLPESRMPIDQEGNGLDEVVPGFAVLRGYASQPFDFWIHQSSSHLLTPLKQPLKTTSPERLSTSRHGPTR
ncbi:hypothetical protein LX88_007684 [Lentzea californiensis]|nr:hypothetical protein [Lentzea californiensis]